MLKKKKIPVYGNGLQIREWLFVDDHCEALIKLIKNGSIGENYNIGNDKGIKNIELISIILNILKQMSIINDENVNNYINFIDDRLGHDKKYAINSDKIKKQCNWFSKTNLIDGLGVTINSIIN